MQVKPSFTCKNMINASTVNNSTLPPSPVFRLSSPAAQKQFCISEVKMEMEKNDGLGSVSVEAKRGVGLPYAPVDWPEPGDVWTWKVGKRISNDGFYRDRNIFLPKRLHQKGKRKYFDSKKIIIAYLQSEFPDRDVDAFFKSFTWKVPANFNSCGEAEITSCPKKVQPRSISEKNGGKKFRRRSLRVAVAKSSSRKRVRFSPKEVKDVIDLSWCSNGTGSCDSTADNSKSATDSKNIQASSSHDTCSQSSKAVTHSDSYKETPSKLIPNDNDMLMDSADNILSQSFLKSSDVGLVPDQSTTSQEQMLEARNKLLLLLATDNHVLLSSIKLPEIMHLSSLLKTDPNIDANQHGILKLIDVIPLAWKKFQENKKISEAANKSSEDLEINIACVTKLENELNELKGQENNLHKELDYFLRYIEKIDVQISDLQSMRAGLARNADVKKKEVDMLISRQKQAAECLSKVGDEVEMGKKRRQEWELKKKISEEQKAQILSKFDPLREFFRQTF
ncbi:uncharacterized protein LOC141676978 isoform X2 [Apium graveolens]|uniref:uncharacterized protein LOC141676978 isoform X2 n=1 Tax=Apium graveolens TaxID=4045 RepID=UPI003D7AD7A3